MWYLRQAVSVSGIEERTTQLAVRAEQIRTLYRQRIWVFLMNPVNAVILSMALWGSASRGFLVSWSGVMVAVTTGRLLLRQRYERVAPAPAESAVWRFRFVMGATLTGLTWGLGGALLHDSFNHTTRLLVVFVVGGMTAGAAGTLAFYVPAFVGFAAGSIVPLVIRLALERDTTSVVMAVLVALFGLTLTMVALNTQRALTESIRLRFVNEELLKRLFVARQSLEEVNRTLEQRVAERGSALERQSETLRDAQRMESVGLLAGGIAHDFNNLLTVIMGNVDILLADHALGSGALGSVNEIQGATSRGAALVRQLLAFGRRQVMVPKVLDLNAVVGNMQTLLGRVIGDHVDMVVEPTRGRVLVTMDPRQLEQVIINLTTNARDAMPTGGRLTIKTDSAEVGDGERTPATVGVRAGRYVVLVVGDSGVGMDGETRRQIFDPFFTTKELGKGTGLGLATVHGIVQQSGGHIVVDSQLGHGSRFLIYLPRAPEDAEVDSDDTDGIASAGRLAPKTTAPARILVAEDHPLVRSVLSRVLLDLGHEVLVVGNGEEALKLSRDDEGQIDLLITDVVMAKMGGLELAKHLVAERADLRVLLISGYSRDVPLPAGEPHEGIDFLQKPFTPQELAGAVARLLSTISAGPSSLAARTGQPAGGTKSWTD